MRSPPTARVAEVLREAGALHRGGRLGEAEKLYRRVLAAAPKHPDALHYLGVLRHHQGHSDEALALIRRSVKLKPESADYHNNLGNVLKEARRPREAQVAYRRALALAPGHPGALCNLGAALCATDDRDEAVVVLRELIGKVPRHALAHCLLGRLLRRQVETVDEAIEHLKIAIAELPGPGAANAFEDLRIQASSLLGISCYKAGRIDEASEAFRNWLARSPGDPVAAHMLAACAGAPAPERATDAYVRETFDRMADTFDEHLVEHLRYRAPTLTAEALAAVLPAPAGQFAVLDAGCATGLCAAGLKPWARRLTGVDLSERMLGLARQRGQYDELVAGELTAYLGAHPLAFEAIACADTLCYFGDLCAVTRAAGAALKPGGWFVFTVERLDDAQAEHRLLPHGRYAHHEGHLRRVLASSGFADEAIRGAVLREELGSPVEGWVVTARAAVS